MNIFYDLETTGLETKHQILSACFIKTDKDFKIISRKNWNVALNSLEIPAESAIRTNSVDLTKHMMYHENKFDDLITEYDFADQLNEFLSRNLSSSTTNLIGYNSNKFDIQFLRKVLIKHGHSPYYSYNKFGMIDLYHHIKLFKAKHKELSFESLKLGVVYSVLFNEIAQGQHEAESDTENCVKIAKLLKEKYKHDIVQDNYKTNNIFDLSLDVGDSIAVVNINSSEQFVTNFVIHDVQANYILAEGLTKENEKYFKLFKKTDFVIAKKLKPSKQNNFKTIAEYFSESGKQEVENFIYHIPFNDFPRLKNVKTFNNDWGYTSEISNSQLFNRKELIKCTTNGLMCETLSPIAKDFFIKYYETYLKEETDKVSDDSPQLELLRDYRQAYKDLYKILKEV